MTKLKAFNKEFAVLIQGKPARDWGVSSSQAGDTVPQGFEARASFIEKRQQKQGRVG